MDNLYYIPEIEEFRVGFEFEYDNSREWMKHVVEINYYFEDLLYNIGSGEIRVKYLDKQDIEECGFTHTKTVLQEFYEWKDVHIKPEVYGYRIWELQCCHRPDTHWFELKAHFEDDNWSTLFEGKIRNKSELKKLLKQIGI